MPFALAAHSINYFLSVGPALLRQHNQSLIDQIITPFEAELVSPLGPEQRSGTAVLQFGERQGPALSALEQANIGVDWRQQGMRISPHIYNTSSDVEQLIHCLSRI